MPLETWKELQSRFEALMADEESLRKASPTPRPLTAFIVLDDPDDRWHFNLSEGPSLKRSHFRARFRQVATDAGVRLDGRPRDANPLEYWLHRLFEYCVERDTSFLVAESESGGVINSVCEASATFCAWLDTKAIEAAQEEKGIYDLALEMSADAMLEDLADRGELTRKGDLVASPRNPWKIWEDNRQLPDSTARQRLHQACKDFKEQVEEKVLKNNNFCRLVKKPLSHGQSFSYREPDPDAMLPAFCKVCYWFLGEVSEAFIDHVSRKGLAGDSGIVEFERSFQTFTGEAFKHNWQWGLQKLHIDKPNVDLWSDLVREVREWKIDELKKLWATATPSPKPSTSSSRRLPSTVESKAAARRMEAFLRDKGMTQTDFAATIGTTDRTLRSFRKTGKLRNDIFHSVARALGISPEELLKNE